MSLLGCRVSLVEHGECFQGRVMSEDVVLGRLAVRLEEGGGLQNFFLKDLTTLKVMERPREVPRSMVSRSMVSRTVESKEFRKSKEAEQEDSGLASEEETRKSSCSQDTRKSSFSQEPVSLRGAEVGSTGRLGTPGGRNCHLLYLNKVNMSSLLGVTVSSPVPGLTEYTDSDGRSYRQLPAVGGTGGTEAMQGGVRERLWPAPDISPQLVTPSRLYQVDNLEQLDTALASVREAGLVGLAGEGVALGRAAPLSWLLLATSEAVFMVDIQRLGEEGWGRGLRALLEDRGVLKVTHDCRALSDCLWHRHRVLLEGVWDLLVGDTVFKTSSLQAGLLPRYTRSLAHLLKDYLGLPDTFLPFPRYRRSQLATDLSAAWDQRPLPPHLLLTAAGGVIYLPALYRMVRSATLLSFNRAVAFLNSQVRDSEAPDAGARVPPSLLRELEAWGEVGSAGRLQGRGLMVQGGWVHNNVGNPDPLLIFSKDCMHQVPPKCQNPLKDIFD